MRRLLDGFPFCVHFADSKTSPTVNLAPDTARWTRRSQRTRRRALTIELLEGRTLLSTLPVVITGAATSVSTVGATLHASVNPEGSTTTVRFQYSTEPWFSPTLESAVVSDFSRPMGVAVDAHGDVIVADWGKNAVT
jgi:hypothetical protein